MSSPALHNQPTPEQDARKNEIGRSLAKPGQLTQTRGNNSGSSDPHDNDTCTREKFKKNTLSRLTTNKAMSTLPPVCDYGFWWIIRSRSGIFRLALEKHQTGTQEQPNRVSMVKSKL